MARPPIELVPLEAKEVEALELLVNEPVKNAVRVNVDVVRYENPFGQFTFHKTRPAVATVPAIKRELAPPAAPELAPKK